MRGLSSTGRKTVLRASTSFLDFDLTESALPCFLATAGGIGAWWDGAREVIEGICGFLFFLWSLVAALCRSLSIDVSLFIAIHQCTPRATSAPGSGCSLPLPPDSALSLASVLSRDSQSPIANGYRFV